MDKYKPVRKEIEEWVSVLPKDKQKKVIDKFREENYKETYNELAVGNILNKLGFRTVYEKNIEGKTPDWYVYSKGGKPAIIVEVLTIKFSEKNKNKLRNIRYFLDKLETIPHGVLLNVKFRKIEISFNKGTVNTILNKIQKWLIKCNPKVGDQFTQSGITFEILPFEKKITHVITGGPGIADFPKEKAVKNKIRNKIRTYRELVEKEKKPFVIGIIDDSLISFSFSSLHNILFEERKGFFQKRSIFSAAIWVYKERNEWKVKPIYNPNAEYPLPDNIFG